MNRIIFTPVVAFMLLLTQSVVVNASEIEIWTAKGWRFSTEVIDLALEGGV